MDNIWSDCKGDLEEVEQHIKKSLDSEVAIITTVAHHILNGGGKRIRPLLLILSARLCAYTGGSHIALAGIVEFIHTATLLHDDVIDNEKIRRGISAARVLWGNRESILVGDYLYTLAMCQAVMMENIEVNYLLSATCRKMTEGETLQLVHNNNLELTEANYFQIIEYKTASLISACCRLGGIIAGAPDVEKNALTRFGQNLGLAFQVADDTLDYVADRKRLGKSLGKDLKEGKITLPLLHLLQNCNEKEKKSLKEIILGRKFFQKDLAYVIGLMEKHGSTHYALAQAKTFVNRAKEESSLFKDSRHRQALEAVADYVIRRDH